MININMMVLMFRHRMKIEIFEDLNTICVMVYEIEADIVVLSKEGKYYYIPHDLVCLLQMIIMMKQMIMKSFF